MNVLPDRPGTRRVQTAGLVAAPIAGLVTTLMWPQTPLDTGDRLEVLAGMAGRAEVAHLLNLLAIVLFIPALAGMYRLLQPHRARVAAVGGALVAAGLVGWSGVLALGAAELQLARTLSGAEAVSTAEALQRSPVANAMLVMFLLCTFSGLVTLAVGMWRAGVVPGWVAAAVSVAVIADIVASTVTAAVVAVWILLTVAFGQMARTRARTPNVVEHEARVL